MTIKVHCTSRRATAAFGAAWLALMTAGAASAADYTPLWNGACGMGEEIEAGCAAVRARPIVDAGKYPWSAIGRINISADRTARIHCTGVLIGERLVLTVAHCLFLKRLKRWVRAREIHFVAGLQRGEFIAHSTGERYTVSDVQDVTGRAFVRRRDADWAVIELREPVGAAAGYLSSAALDDAGLERALRSGAAVALAGYPAIRRHAMSVERGCGTPRLGNGGALLVLRCASMKGDSGAPVLLLKDGKAIVVAVLSGLHAGSDGVRTVGVTVATFDGAIGRYLTGVRRASVLDGLSGLPGKAPHSPQ